ncbi:PIG-L family deacetylase [bacterium]|nr:PIG-L family deacetylase [bacterium]
MNIFLVSAHPDDMEIGMGGTAAKLAADGATVTSIVLTDGRRSPTPFHVDPDSLVELRQEEARRAGRVLGIQEVLFFNLPDLKSSENFETARNRLQETISRIEPAEVYTLHPQLDRHPSHQLAGSAVLKALKGRTGVTLWTYEVWGLFNQWDRFEDISSFISKKIQAISEHKSQVACVPYSEGVTGLNRWRAIFADPQQTTIQAAFAEVFIRYPVPES